MQRILELSQVKISKHLSYLKKREMVEAKRVGNKVFYSLPENTPQELENNLKCLQDCVQEYPVFNEDLKRIQNETTRSFSSRK
jgi:ArsR family transcriptional regulator